MTERRHSRYQRTLADLPWAGRAVRLHLRVRRFFSFERGLPSPGVHRRLSDLAAPRARKTQRVAALCQQLGLALGGEAGARLSRQLSVLTSQTTIVRLVRQTPDPPAGAPQHIGIDDFAFRKGHTYGTILIDHDSGAVLDLLPDRNSESVAAWLRGHPSIIVITRDRAEVYAEGARQGAPQALQVADRWHLLKNLSEQDDLLHPAVSGIMPGAGSDPPPDPASLSPEPVPAPAPPELGAAPLAANPPAVELSGAAPTPAPDEGALPGPTPPRTQQEASAGTAARATAAAV